MWGNKNPDAPKTAQPEPKAQQAEKENKTAKTAVSPSGNTAPDTAASKAAAAPVDSAPGEAAGRTENTFKTTPLKPASGEREEWRTMSTDALKPIGAPASGSIARLGSFLHIKGEITGSEDLQIDGTVEGLVQLDEKKLIVGTSAKLTTDIIAREIVVLGSVKGNLHAKERIELKKEASVQGDLTTARIMIEEGAYFKGSIEIDRTGEKSAPKSTSASSIPATVGPKNL